METELNNTATVLGNYNNIPTEISTQTLVVTMLTGLTVTKTADKLIWSEGNLTYKIEINNATNEPYTSPVITDILNPSLITLVKETIKVDDTPLEESQYTYDENTGKLTISLSDITAQNKKTVTFEVKKK